MILNLQPTTVADTLTILPTYQCTAACKDCCFGSNPLMTGRLSQDRILAVIDEAASTGIKLVVFSGGETFLLGKDLIAAIAHANRLGISTRCVTNGYWAVSKEAALEQLCSLQEAGLSEINFSTGDLHQEWIPISRVVNGCVAALELSMRCAVMVEVRKDRLFDKNLLLSDSELDESLKDPTKRRLFSIVESPWMPSELDSEEFKNSKLYKKRVISEPTLQEESLLANKDNVVARGRCSSVLSTFVIDPNGNVGACCGLTRHRIPEMMMGSIEDHSLKELMEVAFNDFMKIWLYVEGPEKILAWAAKKDPSIEWENLYGHICHACLALYEDEKVRRVIREHHEEKLADVYLRYYLLTQAPQHHSTELPDNSSTQFA